MFSSNEVHQLRICLSDISLTYNELSGRIKSSETAIVDFQPTVNTLQQSLQAIQSNVGQHFENSSPQTVAIQPTQSVPPTLRVETSVQRSCTGFCKCTCHRPTTLSSPKWLRGLIGLLFIGYSGIPLPNRNSRPCSENLCRKNSSSLLKVNYYFPPWFLSRMIALRDRWTPTDSHMLTVRTPRVVHNLPLFVAVQEGNLAQIQMLFAQGKASPFDVDLDGISALIVSMVLSVLRSCNLWIDKESNRKQSGTKGQSSVNFCLLNMLVWACFPYCFNIPFE